MVYTPQTPPSFDALSTQLQYMQRELLRISSALTQLDTALLTEQHREPVKPRVGMLAYADGADWDPGYGSGTYAYSGSAWVPLGATIFYDGSAVGDGTHDDTEALQTVLSAGRRLVLHPSKTYLITEPLLLTVQGAEITAPLGSTIILKMAAGAFDNDVFADRADPVAVKNAVGVYVEGLDGTCISGGAKFLRIVPSTYVDVRYITPVMFNECTNPILERVEITNFSRGAGLVKVRDCIEPVLRFNFIHDCYTASTTDATGTTIQMTGIDVDDNASTGSKNGIIAYNSIGNLTNSAAILSLVGNVQSDAITLKGTDGKTHGFVVTKNYLYNVAEAVDNFGWYCLIVDNYCERIFGAGVKIFHGATGNLISGNFFYEIGFAALYTGGSFASHNPSRNNSFVNNKIVYVNRKIDWIDAEGDVFYDSSSGTLSFWTDTYAGGAGTITAGIRVDVLGAAITAISLPSSTTATITYTGTDWFEIGDEITIYDALGMTEINDATYTITAVDTGANTVTVTTPTNSGWGVYTSGGRIDAFSQCQEATFHNNDMDLGGNADRGFFHEGNKTDSTNYVGPHKISGIVSGGRPYQDSGNHTVYLNFSMDKMIQSEDRTFANNTSAQTLLDGDGTLNGTFSVAAGDWYEVEFDLRATGLSGSAKTVALTFDTTGTFTVIDIDTLSSMSAATSTVVAAQMSVIPSDSSITVTASSSDTHLRLTGKGTIMAGATGVITPQVTQETASAAMSLKTGSWVGFRRISQKAVALGGMSQWS